MSCHYKDTKSRSCSPANSSGRYPMPSTAQLCLTLFVCVEHNSGVEGVEIVWVEQATAHMMASHHVTTTQAEEALTDPERVAHIPDPASKSGTSDRYIGWSTSRHELLVVIVIHEDNIVYGGNAWPANTTAQRIDEEREDTL